MKYYTVINHYFLYKFSREFEEKDLLDDLERSLLIFVEFFAGKFVVQSREKFLAYLQRKMKKSQLISIQSDKFCNFVG